VKALQQIACFIAGRSVPQIIAKAIAHFITTKEENLSK